MLKVNFYLDGEKINEPINYQELALELNFDKDDPDFRGQVSTNQWEIGLGEGVNSDGANLINKYISKGLTGGYGVFEGIEFRIELENNGTTDTLFNGYLDLTESEVLCDRINAKAVESGGVDWLNEVADSFTFEYLATSEANGGAGTITKDDYALVPYVLSTVPDTQALITVIITEFVIVREIEQIIREIQEQGSELSGDTLEFGNIFSLFIAVIELFILVTILINLIVRMVNLLIQPIKYQSGMYLRDLCIKGAEHLGYKFQSTILDNYPFNQVVAVPQSFEQNKNDFAQSDNTVTNMLNQGLIPNFFFGIIDPRLGISSGYYRGSFGAFLREMKTLFNAKVFIEDDGTDKILRLERIDYNPSIDNYQLPPIDRTNVPYRFNFNDFSGLYSVKFTPDIQDKNVWQNYLGTEVQLVTTFVRAKNELNVLTKGEDIRQSGFAVSRRKTRLTSVESYFKKLARNVDRLIGGIERSVNSVIRRINLLIKAIMRLLKLLRNLGIKLASNLRPLNEAQFNFSLEDTLNIDARINVLSLETDFVNVPKLVMLNTADKNANYKSIRLSSTTNFTNEDIVNANYLYDNFHYINSFVGDNHNQHKIYTVEVPFCIDDYNKIKKSNIIVEADGITQGQIISLKWNIYRQVAEITYKVREKYTNNLRETKIISDGK